MCTQDNSEQIVLAQNTFPLNLKMLLSYRQSGVSVLHIVCALNCFSRFRNVVTVLVDVVIFTMVKVENLM